MMYNVIGIQPRGYGVKNKEEMMINLRHIKELVDNAMNMTSRVGNPKLVVIPEVAFQGWLDLKDHIDACRNQAIEIPGKETEFLADIAKEHNVYLYANARALWPEVIKDRHFNTCFLIDPNGEI